MPELAPPLVSVVVPTFNRAYCLEQTLRSAMAQSHTTLEIIVVDDGSTDGTEALVRKLQAEDPRIRYHRQPNGGVAAARNAGLRLAQGAYVAFLDSDDRWRPWKIALQVRALQVLPDAGMVWTDLEAIDPQGRMLAERYLRRMYTAYRWFPGWTLFDRHLAPADWLPEGDSSLPAVDLYAGDIYSPMIMGSLVHTSTVLLRKDWAERTGGFPEECRPLGEDYPFHLRTSRLGPVAFLDVSSISYQRGMADRLTRPDFEIHLASNFLKTVEETLRTDAARIKLPARMIRSVRADAQRWVATLHFGARRLSEAAPHFAASLRLEPWRPMTWAQWAICQLPARWATGLLALRRRLIGNGP